MKKILFGMLMLLAVICCVGLDRVYAEGLPQTTYKVSLQVTTNGQKSNIGGELLTEKNILEGKAGDVIKLIPKPKPGYIFNGYKSYRTDDGASTDGLLDIVNNKFELSDKIGNVTIYADFIKEVKDPDVYFKEDFNQNNSLLRFDYSNDVKLSDGAVLLSPKTQSSYLKYNLKNISVTENSNVGYGLAFSLGQVGEVKEYNTVRIIFRSSGAIKYFLELTGKKALLKKSTNQGENILDEVNFKLDRAIHTYKINVIAGNVNIEVDNHAILNYSLVKDDSFNNTRPVFDVEEKSLYRSVVLDNIEIKKINRTINIKVLSMIDSVEDKQHIAGTVTLSNYKVIPGEKVKISCMNKPGYQFQSYEISQLGSFINNEFIVPNNVQVDSITLIVKFKKSTSVSEKVSYYIDSNSGNDSNSGKSESEPWRSLNNLKHVVLNPGDKILLKSGSKFYGKQSALSFKGSGTSEDKIIITSYGNGDRPQLNGQGEIENVISLFNQEYITIKGLEITNLSSRYNTSFLLNSSNNRSLNLRGINVSAKDYGIVHGITIQDMYIHDINGNISSKWNGGIFFDVKATVNKGTLEGVPTKYDSILIENCKLEKVDRSAIKLISSSWCNQSTKNNSTLPINWYPSTNVVVKDNRINKVGGDGITVRDTDKALIEYNLVTHARYQNTGYNAGIWPFEASNTVIQYNEVAYTHGVQDGQGFDCDHLCKNTVMQYNYSHNNEGGFMLIMNGFPHTGPTVRYNISQNDNDKTFEFSRGIPSGTAIYSNTIYSKKVLSGRSGIIDVANSKAGTGNREAYLFNNIFYYPNSQSFYVLKSEAPNNKAKFHLDSNCYLGGISQPDEETNEIKGIVLNNAGSGPEDINADRPRTGKYLINELVGYKSNSALPKELDFNSALKKWGRLDYMPNNKSPLDYYNEMTNKASVEAIAINYPEINGVSYNQDFFGNKISNHTSSVGAFSE
ncbi:hypothetical protein J2Z60_000760 [Lactobacillus colini]|uniref:Right handed beta helix domain-containing protein n=1 Tax=Lactobacillus colini TaxID=1819254 RepID=A0ABS4MDX4_9LACO|nr:right-handed parallel beta-helix repeat-containing protein [Lactobacillus colini]MBP2057589.1 hypothetical protein [Lactobacillus colini]